MSTEDAIKVGASFGQEPLMRGWGGGEAKPITKALWKGVNAPTRDNRVRLVLHHVTVTLARFDSILPPPARIPRASPVTHCVAPRRRYKRRNRDGMGCLHIRALVVCSRRTLLIDIDRLYNDDARSTMRLNG
jgi:hypothetical protein